MCIQICKYTHRQILPAEQSNGAFPLDAMQIFTSHSFTQKLFVVDWDGSFVYPGV